MREEVNKGVARETYIEQRPWGKFEQFTHDESTTVKILSINSQETLSLQYHRHREEFWKIISGNALVTIGDITCQADEEDEFFIAKGQKHRIETEGCSVKVLEISFGNFDENDIVRLKDKYKRSKDLSRKLKNENPKAKS